MLNAHTQLAGMITEPHVESMRMRFFQVRPCAAPVESGVWIVVPGSSRREILAGGAPHWDRVDRPLLIDMRAVATVGDRRRTSLMRRGVCVPFTRE